MVYCHKPGGDFRNNQLIEFKDEIHVSDGTRLVYYNETGLPRQILVGTTRRPNFIDGFLGPQSAHRVYG